MPSKPSYIFGKFNTPTIKPNSTGDSRRLPGNCTTSDFVVSKKQPSFDPNSPNFSLPIVLLKQILILERLNVISRRCSELCSIS